MGHLEAALAGGAQPAGNFAATSAPRAAGASGRHMARRVASAARGFPDAAGRGAGVDADLRGRPARVCGIFRGTPKPLPVCRSYAGLATEAPGYVRVIPHHTDCKGAGGHAPQHASGLRAGKCASDARSNRPTGAVSHHPVPRSSMHANWACNGAHHRQSTAHSNNPMDLNADIIENAIVSVLGEI